MPGCGVQGGERSQPFVLSYSQLFFTCASFHNNKREFNFNALSGKKGGGGASSYTILKQRWRLASAVKYICTQFCMRQRRMTGATRMTSTQTRTAAWILSCNMLKTHTQPQSRTHTKTQAYAAPPLRNKDQNKNTLKHHYFIIQHNGVAGGWGGLHISMCIPRTWW